MNLSLFMVQRISFFLLCAIPNIIYGMNENVIILTGGFKNNFRCPIGEIKDNTLSIGLQEQEALTHCSLSDLVKHEHGSLLGVVETDNWYHVYEGGMLLEHLKSCDKDPETRMPINGVCYYVSIPSHKNMYTCIGNDAKLIKKARKAVSGSRLGAYSLGLVYKNGDVVSQNYSVASEWFIVAANQRHSVAMAELAFMYKHALGVLKDSQKSEEWRVKAASIMLRRGWRYDKKKEFKRARHWFLKAAHQGSGAAMYNLGMLYEYGEGVEKDEVKALTWYEQAAATGDTDAYVAVGQHYEKFKDEGRAREYYQRAADRGNTNALYMLGKLIEKKNSFTPEVIQYYTKAAEKGHARAMKKMGDYNSIYNEQAAIAWYRKAIAAGDESVILKLDHLRGSSRELSDLLIEAFPTYVRVVNEVSSDSKRDIYHKRVIEKLQDLYRMVDVCDVNDV